MSNTSTSKIFSNTGSQKTPQIDQQDMMVYVVKCPVCSNTHLEPYLSELVDYAVTQEKFNIIACSHCQQLMTSPRPSTATLYKYYASERYMPHHSKGVGLLSIVYNLVRNYMTNYKIKRISKFIDKGIILDYGAGNGLFVKGLYRKGYTCMGYEPNAVAIANADKSIRSLLYNQTADIDQKYQMITLWHVLEHIPDLNETINWIYQHLSPKGYVVIAVPNTNAYERDIYREKWAAFDVPRHIWHFNQKTLPNCIKKHGFELVDRFPLLFDAYFVALLSEQYKGCKIPWLKALYRGFQSNQRAKKNMDYTSLTYIFRKC